MVFINYYLSPKLIFKNRKSRKNIFLKWKCSVGAITIWCFFSCLSLPLLIKSIIVGSFIDLCINLCIVSGVLYFFLYKHIVHSCRRVFHVLLQHDVWVGLSELYCSHIGHSYNEFRHALILHGIWVDLSELHCSHIGHSCSECHHDLSIHAVLDGFFVLL